MCAVSVQTKVWAEPEVIDAASFEFSETETYVRTIESLLGPYVWGRYDLLMLPPSFPYGGMENPCMTFVTPTLLVGDRSLADVIVHEAAHSVSIVTHLLLLIRLMNPHSGLFIGCLSPSLRMRNHASTPVCVCPSCSGLAISSRTRCTMRSF
jgi:hypothetical protein